MLRPRGAPIRPARGLNEWSGRGNGAGRSGGSRPAGPVAEYRSVRRGERRNKPCRIGLNLRLSSHRNGLVKIMLFREHSANETFSPILDPRDEPSRVAEMPRRPVPEAWSGIAAPALAPGDEVVFDRLDLAEILGIWRHARGRVVGLDRPWGAAATVDVQFEGHETLERYLPDLFRRVH